MTTNFITTIKERILETGNSEFYIELPPEILIQLNWKEDDVIDWEIFPEFAVLTKKII